MIQVSNLTDNELAALAKTVHKIEHAPYTRLDVESIDMMSGANSLEGVSRVTPTTPSRVSFSLMREKLYEIRDSVVLELNNRHIETVVNITSFLERLETIRDILEKAKTLTVDEIPNAAELTLYNFGEGYRTLGDPVNPYTFELSNMLDSLRIIDNNKYDAIAISIVNFKIENLLSRISGSDSYLASKKEFNGMLIKDVLDRDSLIYSDIVKLFEDPTKLLAKINELQLTMLSIINDTKETVVSMNQHQYSTDDTIDRWLEISLRRGKIYKYVNDEASLLYLYFVFMIRYKNVEIDI